MSPDLVRHWDNVYRARGPGNVSWFQAEPSTSLQLIEELELAPGAAIIDVGGGASRLADRLLARGFTDVSVLDISKDALVAARSEAGPEDSARVHWIVHDLLDWEPQRPYDLWHDRAVFHFLVDARDRRRYVEVAHAAVRPEGRLVIGTFALDGPDRCSGLPVARHDAAGLAAALGSGFAALASRREEHRTPRDEVQPFTWVVLERR